MSHNWARACFEPLLSPHKLEPIFIRGLKAGPCFFSSNNGIDLVADSRAMNSNEMSFPSLLICIPGCISQLMKISRLRKVRKVLLVTKQKEETYSGCTLQSLIGQKTTSASFKNE